MRHHLPPPRLSREGFVPADAPAGAQRRDMLLPKPPHPELTPYIPALPEHHLAGLIGDLAPNERKALDQIVQTADVLTVAERQWLLVPASQWLLEFLATFGAEFAECEWTLDDEEETDVCEFDKEGDHDGREPEYG